MARPYEWAKKRLTAELKRLKAEIEPLQKTEPDQPFAGSDKVDVAAQISAADNRRAQVLVGHLS